MGVRGTRIVEGLHGLALSGEAINLYFKLQNTGNFDSDEVAQLYVSFPDSKVERPIRELKGFKRVFVPKGQSVDVTIPLNSGDQKYWDDNAKSFILEKGTVNFFIGGSSDDARINGNIEFD